MARGFESKAIADQQESKVDSRPSGEPVEMDPARISRRRKLELSRADVKQRLATAQAKGHRQMLERALSALDREIASLE
jgi:hypothetical protein